jgi:hypothetical protein
MTHSMMFLKLIIKIVRQNVIALDMMTHSITNLDVSFLQSAVTLSVMAPRGYIRLWGMVAVICILAASQPYKYNWGVRKLTGETLKVVWAEF